MPTWTENISVAAAAAAVLMNMFDTEEEKEEEESKEVKEQSVAERRRRQRREGNQTAKTRTQPATLATTILVMLAVVASELPAGVQAARWGVDVQRAESREMNPKRGDSAVLSRYGRGGSAVLSRYGKRSSLFAPYHMESPLTDLESTVPLSRAGAALASKSSPNNNNDNNNSKHGPSVGYQFASEQLFLCRRALGDMLRCVPYSSTGQP